MAKNIFVDMYAYKLMCNRAKIKNGREISSPSNPPLISAKSYLQKYHPKLRSLDIARADPNPLMIPVHHFQNVHH